jgi:hypothetical protein
LAFISRHLNQTAQKVFSKEGILRTSKTGDVKIALTTERSVAEYFACNAVFGDRHDHPEEESSGVVLVFNGEGLLARNYDLSEFRDHFWGRGGV